MIENINATIGIPFEVIVIENEVGAFGISEAYNQGAAKATFDIYCFMHEDIAFETLNWGEKVLIHLSEKSVGLIGVAGGDTKNLTPTSWSASIFESEISIIQHYKNNGRPPERILKTGYPENKNLIKPVACLDGVWMCTRRDVFEQHKFDSETFKGFHGYDIDFSLQVFKSYKVCVVFDILVNHYSDGSFNKIWMKNMMLLSKKWKGFLPVSVRPLTKKEFITQHWTSMSAFIEHLLRLDYRLDFILFQFLKYSINKFFHFFHFSHFLKLILNRYFKKKEN